MFWLPRVRTFPVCAALAFALVTVPQSAAAGDKAAAKAAYEEGRTAANAGRFKEAVKLFKRSIDEDPNPQTRLELAKALIGDEKLVDANTVLNELLNASPPVIWSVKSAAQKLRTEIEPRIPWIQIKIVGPDPALTSLTIDQKDVDRSKIDVDSEIPFNPGEHVIGAEADGYEPAEKTITLKEGTHEVVELTLSKKGSGGPGTDTPPPTTTSSGGLTSAPLFIPMAISLGVGAVGLGVGGVFGGLAISKANEVKDTCDGSVCPNSSRNKTAKEDSLLYGNISTVSFIVGGVAAAAGVALLVINLNAPAEKPKEPPAGYVRPWIGLGQAGVYGKF